MWNQISVPSERSECSWDTFSMLLHPRSLWLVGRRDLQECGCLRAATGCLCCCEMPSGSHCISLRSWAVWTPTMWTAPRSRWRSWIVTPSRRSRRRSLMPSSRMCPAPTGPKLLIWTWVCECTTGPDCPRTGGRGEVGDSHTWPRNCLLGHVPCLQTGCTLGACARQSSSNVERAEESD